MKIFCHPSKIIGRFLFVIIFLSTSQVKSLDKFDKAEQLSNYFSGTLLLSQNEYEDSLRYFKKLNGLESSHINFSVKYLYSLVNSGNFKQAFNYSKRLEKQKLDNFESNLIIGIYHLKNSNNQLAQKYFLKAKSGNERFILNNYISNSLHNWSRLTNINQAEYDFQKLDTRFENLKKIENVFLNCHFDSSKTINLFSELAQDQKTDFSRYNYFHASYVASKGKINKAKKIVKSALELYPRNLLLNQYNIDLIKNKNVKIFDCKNKEHVVAEILYIAANALSSQSMHLQSNFYLNLAKYLNEDFHSYNILLAENFYKIDSYQNAKKIYNNLSKKGEAFHWYSSKQLARIFLQQKNKNEALKLLKKSYNSLLIKEIYETFDYAEFLKNNEKFEESIPLYTIILNQVEKEHPLYSEAADGRGVSYERIGEWDKAEKDLLDSLEVNPDQAHVINYLAYSWIEKGIKVKKSLSMLKKANKLRSNDPYITDSLGWALFKLKRYQEAKDYLQLAVRLLPADPIVNDHYGDVLWRNGNEIQARYYWNYVLNLEKTDEKLKKKLEDKIIKGL
mgnify:CR=1 FL=1